VAAHVAQLGEGEASALALDLALAQDDLDHAMRLAFVTAVAHILDQEDARVGDGEKDFTRRLLGQVRRHHVERGEGTPIRMHVAGGHRH